MLDLTTPAPRSIEDLVEGAASAAPGRRFLVAPDAGSTLTRGELARAVGELRARLRAAGLSRGDRVALLLSNGPNLAVALLAVMSSGATAVPLHPRLAPAELAALLADAGPALVLADARHRGAAPSPARELLAALPGPVALCVLPIFHVNGLVVTTLAPLLSGGTVVMPGRFEADRFWALVAAHGVTWFSGVPTVLSALLARPAPAPASLRTLRFARSASAPLPTAVLNEFEARFGVPVIESLGMSEAAGQVTSNPLPPAIRKPGSVGVPFGNELRIVDEDGRAVAPGVVGEVALRGANLFAGYLGGVAPEAHRDGWFLTGDLGYVDGDGYLFLTGRRKELINRAGEKIAPREVEEVLHRRAEVQTACVVGVPDPLYGEEVVAFVELRPGQAFDADGIAAHCREHLARFKAPKQVFRVDGWPRGPNGKVQRRHLVDLYQRLTEPQPRSRT